MWGRRRGLLGDRALWVSVVAGPLLTWLINRLPSGDLEIKEVGAAGLSYASIAFGACITGVVLSLSLPSAERVQRWATRGRSKSTFSHYSDLVFVLTWSAIAQLAVITMSLGGYLFGADIAMAPDEPRLSHLAALCASMAIATYALLQLFTLVSTLSQIAYVTIDEAIRDAGGGASPSQETHVDEAP